MPIRVLTSAMLPYAMTAEDGRGGGGGEDMEGGGETGKTPYPARPAVGGCLQGGLSEEVVV